MTTATFPGPRSARGRVLRLMSSVRRPVTGGEILGYALTGCSAAHARAVMEGMTADGLVTTSEAYHPNARGRRTRIYRLAANAPDVTTEGGAP